MIENKYFEQLFELVRRRYPEDSKETQAQLATHLCRQSLVTRNRWGQIEVHPSARAYAGRLFDEVETYAAPDTDEDRLALINKLFDRTSAKIGRIPDPQPEGTRLDRAAEHRRRAEELRARGNDLDAYSEFVKAAALEESVRAETQASELTTSLQKTIDDTRAASDVRRERTNAVQDLQTTGKSRDADSQDAANARRTTVEANQRTYEGWGTRGGDE